MLIILRDVELSILSCTNLVRALSRTEKDDLEDGQLTYDQISPLDRAKTLSHEVNIMYYLVVSDI